MTAFRPRLRALVVGAAAIALVTIGAGGTLAASTTPTVYACYNVNGQVAMASIAQCKLAGGGQLVQINTQGILGPTGATGATGPAGPTGSGTTTELLTVTIPAPYQTVYDSPAFTVRLACTGGPGSLYVGYDIDEVGGAPLTFAIAHQGVNPVFQTLPAGRQVIGGWDTTTNPGAADLWVSGGGSAFHALVAAYAVPDTSTCQMFVTY